MSTPTAEPAWGTRITMPNGRSFVRRVDEGEFHWADGIGWYRWSEVRGRMEREGGWIDNTTPAPSPDALGDPESAEEAVVARDRARQGAELHGGAGWTRQSGEEEGT